MKKGFNFEANLPHQKEAVDSLMGIFKDSKVNGQVREYQNNIVEFNNKGLSRNIKEIQVYNELGSDFLSADDKIFDIHMETGTGKTYTYTKSIFEMNKYLGVYKFIIVVPTLAIKAGTVNFLKSKSTKEHFRFLYGKEIKAHIVESKENKGKKSYIPSSIAEFVRSTNMSGNIQVLVINSGMINSKTIETKFDSNLLDKYNIPLEGIKACNPITIIDEPHKFPDTGKTFKKLLEFNSQFIVRYGATFKDKNDNFTYKNLLYSLNSIKAFNQDLVKGINTHVLSFKGGEDCHIMFKDSNGKEAIFELNDNGRKSTCKFSEGEVLDSIHPEIKNLKIDRLNKSVVALDNGVDMKKGDKINPYSYAVTTQEHMIRDTIQKHFELEKELLTREVKIKPLTLFFIDNIKSYRNDDNSNGDVANLIERLVEEEVEKLLKVETDKFYIEYLNKTLRDLRSCHGGYFSKDNTGKDDKVEQEINEIIHDKEALLDLDNPRRFIFSKWTLKEGWDNPNVFQICKLRSSGSETSKLQEVGRGLRIPVNEYMERVKDEQFDLEYYVDFTERNFANKLRAEISNDTLIKINEDKLEDDLISKIIKDYGITDEELLERLDYENIINRKNEFKENGLERLKELYPLSFEKLKNGKVKSADEKRPTVTIRKENYSKLKSLWEEINKKVILEYEFKNEKQVEDLFYNYLNKMNLYENKLVMTTHKLDKQTGNFTLQESMEINETAISNLKYNEFIKELSIHLNISINTVHKVFVKLLKNDRLNINNYLNYETIRIIRNEFKNYLIENVHAKFKIKYNEVNNKVHPTILTTKDGNIKNEIKASNVGVEFSNKEKVVDSYLFEELYYDSELEKDNIVTEIKDVVVFTKIPKNSVKIPIVGGYTYSPDFAYIVEYENGKKQLNLVVETKNKSEKDLSTDEENRIKSAEKLFASDFFDVKFKK